ncbi:uncharacterized protein BO96DRAFT_338386 [Aspergillus niger CBS 101883]|uniref:uncharacterized protein n=1 Tax=Aspergillus lacticoffeatus (strain CBS 101883) TaxID=1450533 RepID=UPI000D8008F5|nr:uncharacterized protein BO96DRAFT_338386 [Aspergillus niger CBS 101883]PYH56376.1 hypothetical protein BO96DRAFT_338386 [Aspergillus niger CBS 101883]
MADSVMVHPACFAALLSLLTPCGPPSTGVSDEFLYPMTVLRWKRSCIGHLHVTHSAEYHLSGIKLLAPQDSECIRHAFRLPYQCRDPHMRHGITYRDTDEEPSIAFWPC